MQIQNDDTKVSSTLSERARIVTAVSVRPLKSLSVRAHALALRQIPTRYEVSRRLELTKCQGQVMAMILEAAPIPFAGSKLDGARHVCAFFNNDEDAYRVLLPFIKEGFARGDKALHIVNSGDCDCHLRRLAGDGIDVAAARASGQLEIRINTDAYLNEGKFEQDRMIKLFDEVAGRKSESAFPVNRIVCQMDWAAHELDEGDPSGRLSGQLERHWREALESVLGAAE